MNCEKNREMIQLYADGELEKEKESYVFTHLAECEECRAFFKTLNTISVNIHTYAAALFLLAASIFLYSRTNDYKSIIKDMSGQIQSQAQTIDLLYNTLPTTVVQAKYEHERDSAKLVVYQFHL